MGQQEKAGQINLFDEIIVDNFAGGGGASTGMELAAGKPVAIAINHDPDAILMHKTNHPYTEHLQANVWDVDPEKVCRGRPVGLAWFSPDCKHFSKAKGAALVNRNIRGLAWIVLRWAGTVRPRVIILENKESLVLASAPESAIKEYYHKDADIEARLAWNTRAPILSEREMEMLEGME